MVMPDWSLVVTTFSRQSWLLQRTATRVTSMATFVDKGISNSFSQCRVHANIGARRFFGRSLTRIDQQNRNTSVPVLLARDGYRQRRGMRISTESSGGRGRFAKRRTTGPFRNGYHCLNAATVLDRRAWVR